MFILFSPESYTIRIFCYALEYGNMATGPCAWLLVTSPMLKYDVCSAAFAVALRLVGARVNTIFYSDKTHTDLFLQVCIVCIFNLFRSLRINPWSVINVYTFSSLTLVSIFCVRYVNSSVHVRFLSPVRLF